MSSADRSPTETIPSRRPAAGHSGHWLRQRREERGVTLQAAARHLHMTPSAVLALEESRADQLPPPVFVRGFLRNYARFLELPEAEVLAGYPEPPPAAVNASTGFPLGDLAEGRSLGAAVLALALFAALALAVLKFYGDFGAPREAVEAEAPRSELAARPVSGESAEAPAIPSVPAAAAPAPATMPPAPSPGTPATVTVTTESAAPDGSAGAATLVLRFSGESWLAVVDADGRRLAYESAPAGTTRSLTGKPPFAINLGRPGNVSVELDGRPVPLKSAKNGAPVRLSLGNGAVP